MPSIRHFTSVIAVALSAGAWLGCSSADSEGTASQDEKIGHVDQASTTCNINTMCCTGTAILFDMTDPFQAQLSAWGCAKPKVYSPNQGTTPKAWWLYSQCANPSSRIESFLTSHPQYKLAPYAATVTTTLNTACVPTPPSGYVDVLWDPTCATCKSQ